MHIGIHRFYGKLPFHIPHGNGMGLVFTRTAGHEPWRLRIEIHPCRDSG